MAALTAARAACRRELLHARSLGPAGLTAILRIEGDPSLPELSADAADALEALAADPAAHAALAASAPYLLALARALEKKPREPFASSEAPAHAPHTDQSARTLQAVADFANGTVGPAAAATARALLRDTFRRLFPDAFLSGKLRYVVLTRRSLLCGTDHNRNFHPSHHCFFQSSRGTYRLYSLHGCFNPLYTLLLQPPQYMAALTSARRLSA